jgi:surface polysaccharide O-acyltransferase-like enzyme
MQSKVIDFLRFPLCILVVFIHNQDASIDKQLQETYWICNELFSEILGRVAVPLFFFFSGFLFFLNVNTFNIKNIKNKLESRVKTLLVPYLFWTMLIVIIFNIGLPLLKHKMNIRKATYSKKVSAQG